MGRPARVWIDTDAACGQSPTTDPDDCFAILLLASAPQVQIVGLSTVFGNADLTVTDQVTRELARQLTRDGFGTLPVYRGSSNPVDDGEDVVDSGAQAALSKALKDGPLTLVALGPLTNIDAVLRKNPELQESVTRLIAVMGKRPGHLFHPAEGHGGGMLFGHGPVFRDFNFDKDRRAAAEVLAMHLPMTLVPYDAARQLMITGDDLERMESSGSAASWIAAKAQGWLGFWRKDIGREGFYPFDLLAAAYALNHRLFACAKTEAWVSRDFKLWGWLYGPESMLVGYSREKPADPLAQGFVAYCPQVEESLHDFLLAGLTAGGPLGQGRSSSMR